MIELNESDLKRIDQIKQDDTTYYPNSSLTIKEIYKIDKFTTDWFYENLGFLPPVDLLDSIVNSIADRVKNISKRSMITESMLVAKCKRFIARRIK